MVVPADRGSEGEPGPIGRKAVERNPVLAFARVTTAE